MDEFSTGDQTVETNGVDDQSTIKNMYQKYFLDYASYVILERAIPDIDDGLKPVQRRIMHAMKQMDDGRYHKVANVIGQTMQYHPHGDTAIGDALVHIGQKNLLVDCQGNWGDPRTGDRAAAARYIEARLTKFALDILFNAQTTNWQLSYDGRKKEPISLPAKFPLLLAQGVDGIAVGLSTKILPHNFIELIKASINILKDKSVTIYPDFLSGGQVDVSNYNDGKRGGKVRVRAKIEILDKKTLIIRELPYSITTTSLIESILKANAKGKIKIKKIIDNTAKHVEILVQLHVGISPNLTIDALYAFTYCEISISPSACVIVDDKPLFLTVLDILRSVTANTKALLKWELEIRIGELNESLHFASLEKIFIEKRIYRSIEQCENWEEVLKVVDEGLTEYFETPNKKSIGANPIILLRDITQDDITKLTEIRIKRISKYNIFKAEERILKLKEEIEVYKHHLENLVEYTINFYKKLLEKYGKGKERRTLLTTFDTIKATEVVANNAKLYVNYKEGFIGLALKKDEYVCECSDIDDVIVFRKGGKFMVTKVADKVFVGKNILHLAIWKKGDQRTTYNLVYSDGKTGRTFVKRFNVKAITRDKEYFITQGNPNSKVLHFTVNPNGESEKIGVQLTLASTARTKKFEYNLGDLSVKGRSSKGNLLTKYPVRKITLLEVGKSTLGAQKIWMDDVSGRLNTSERGKFLGEFDTGDTILIIFKDGSYKMTDFELTHRFDIKDIIEVHKFDKDAIVNVMYFEGEKQATYIKRFKIDTSSLNQTFTFITENKNSRLYYASTQTNMRLEFKMRVKSKTQSGEVIIDDFIDTKGWRAMGNRFSNYKITSVKPLKKEVENTEKIKVGETVEFKLFDEK